MCACISLGISIVFFALFACMHLFTELYMSHITFGCAGECNHCVSLPNQLLKSKRNVCFLFSLLRVAMKILIFFSLFYNVILVVVVGISFRQ